MNRIGAYSVFEQEKSLLRALQFRLVVGFPDDGIDTRIHGMKIKSSRGKDLGLNKDFFCAENLVRFPKLECFDPEILYRRSVVLQRFVFAREENWVFFLTLVFMCLESRFSLSVFCQKWLATAKTGHRSTGTTPTKTMLGDAPLP